MVLQFCLTRTSGTLRFWLKKHREECKVSPELQQKDESYNEVKLVINLKE
jgi:hypothetical protein